MLNQKVEKALNEQINEETYSSYLYYSMSAFCFSKDLVGMANWFKVQAMEELVHVAKFFDYVNDRDGKVTLTAIRGPEVEWETPLSMFQAALAHEQHISARIDKLVDIARGESDHATENFLQWFVSEQVEEEANARAIIGQLKFVGNDGHAVYMIDRELATRTFVMPAAPAKGA